jgi:hypothetical protein
VGADEGTEGPDTIAGQHAGLEQGDIKNVYNAISGQVLGGPVLQGRDFGNVSFGTSTSEPSSALKAALIGAVAVVLAAAITALATITTSRSAATDPAPSSSLPSGDGQVSRLLLGPPSITGGHQPVNDLDEGQPAGISPCRTEAQPEGAATPFVDQNRIVGSVQLFKSSSCGTVWAEVQGLNTTHSLAKLHIDVFRNHTEPASEFSVWAIPKTGAHGTLPGLMIARKQGACFYAKIYAGDSPTTRVTQTNPVCL